MSKLFTPYTLRGVTLRNRVMLSPMNQYSAVDGFANDWHFGHLAQYAMGGAGLVCLEATKVERRGMGTIGDLGLWKDEHIAPIKRIADFIRAQGAVPAIQLSHAGRKAGSHRPWEGFKPLDRSEPLGEGRGEVWPALAPSPIPFLEGWWPPTVMTEDDIATVIESFAQAARRADEAGIDVIELHGAHGYLIHQFLSPASNARTDRYGGSLDNRMRFALEVVAAVRKVWPARKALFFRISSVDEGGWTLDDSVVLAQALKAAGVDAIDCSAAGISVRSVAILGGRKLLGNQVQYAERVRRDADVPTIAVGFIVKPEQAEAIVATGQADIVAIAREMVWNPSWPSHAARALGADAELATFPESFRPWLAGRGA